MLIAAVLGARVGLIGHCHRAGRLTQSITNLQQGRDWLAGYHLFGEANGSSRKYRICVAQYRCIDPV